MNPLEWIYQWPLPSIGALGILAGAIGVLIIRKYGRPNIQYRKFDPTAGKESDVRFLVRSFEPDNLCGTLRLTVTASEPMRKIAVVAGPWLQSVKYNDASKKTAVVTLRGFPAEGVIGVRAEPKAGSAQIDVIKPGKDATEDTIVPRSFDQIETPYRPLRAYAWRIAAGFSFGAITYLIGCALLYRVVPQLFQMPPGLFDVLMLGVLLAITFIAFWLAVPRQGKAMFTGAIDWDLAVEAKEPEQELLTK